MKSTWLVVAVYGSAMSRQRAVGFCETLVRRFWARFDFEVSWLSFEDLKVDQAHLEMTRKAAAADLIVFVTEASSGLPRQVREWIEAWLGQRQEREGTLVALQALEETAAPSESESQRYLRQVAHRAGMDFLTDVPEHIHNPFADIPEFYTERATQVTSVLDDILHRPLPPRG